MNSRSMWLPLAVILLIALGPSTAADADNVDRDVAALYVDAAATALGNGDAGRAIELAHLALEYNPVSSDALYIVAIAHAGNQEMTLQAVAAAEAAVESDTWRRFDRIQGIIGLTTLWIQVREYQAAHLLLRNAAGNNLQLTSPDWPEEWLSTLRYLEADALYQLGEIGAANGVVEVSRQRFPNDTRFFYLEMQQESYPSYRYRAELERLLRVNGTADRYYLDSLLLYAESAPTSDEMRWGIDQYLSHGGSDPAIALVALATDGWNRAVALFEELGGYHRVDVMRDLFAAMPEAEAMPQGALSFTGTTTVDGDRDGFVEETLEIVGGWIIAWSVDSDQDGVVEYDIEFSHGEPSRVTVNTTDLPVTIVYDVYPYARSIVLDLPGGNETIVVQPRTVIFRVAQTIPSDGARFVTPIALPANHPQPDMEAYYRTVQRIDRADSDGMVVERRFYEDRELVRSMHDTDSDGVWDRLAIYTAGLPTAVLRDIDGDGYFEVAETYTDGRLAAVVVDDNDNGKPDLYERHDNGGTREWDLDEDGTIDVQEFGFLVDRVRRLFPFVEDRF